MWIDFFPVKFDCEPITPGVSVPINAPQVVAGQVFAVLHEFETTPDAAAEQVSGGAQRCARWLRKQ